MIRDPAVGPPRWLRGLVKDADQIHKGHNLAGDVLGHGDELVLWQKRCRLLFNTVSLRKNSGKKIQFGLTRLGNRRRRFNGLNAGNNLWKKLQDCKQSIHLESELPDPILEFESRPPRISNSQLVELSTQINCGYLLLRVYISGASGADKRSNQVCAEVVKTLMATILVAEDETSVRLLVGSVLEGQGFTVIAADDGETALAAFRKNPGKIDLLVTDVLMPRIGGRRLVRELRSVQPCLPVLYITGYEAHESLEASPGAQTLLLRKPFGMPELIAAVHSLLR